jgi:hypothetical protein
MTVIFEKDFPGFLDSQVFIGVDLLKELELKRFDSV